ncbi:MAG: hypothetical protein KDB03_19930 [Planctomycetales bacterium]|nr:hypothetical protein [Planctomycetales bacterium]
MNAIKICSLAVLTSIICLPSLYAQDPPCCCMCGKKVCHLEVSTEKEEVRGFDVESKEICIPGICLPWNKCGGRVFGGTRKVCVLKDDKKEKTVCKYDWSIKTICSACCQQHGLCHSHRLAETNQDTRVPFEYYVADPEPPTTVLSASPKPVTPNTPEKTNASLSSGPVSRQATLFDLPSLLGPRNFDSRPSTQLR